MLNLRALTRPVITIVNPDQPVMVLASAGYAMGEAFEQIPVWSPAASVMAQVQPVPDSILKFLVQERQNSIWRDFYLMGDWRGLDRADERGGDLLYWDGYEWQVDQVLERWPGMPPTGASGWTKVRGVRQRACPPPAPGDAQPPDPDAAQEVQP